MAEQVNYYQVLGVSREASRDEIRAAYRRLAKERHPDHPSGSADDFSLLQEAHAVLSDPNRRRAHDETLDLAHAADQLSGLDFGSMEDELAARRQGRESSGPPLGERLRDRFRRKEKPPSGGRRQDDVRRRGRYEMREARWYEPHNFDPEPVTWKTGAISFVGTFVAFIAVGQLGLWATGAVEAGPLAFTQMLAPFLPILFTLVGLVAAYFSYRAAGYAGLALAFVAILVVGGQGPPEGLLQFGTLGIILLLVAIWLGNRRERTAR
jgi:molecular chaperone DnaJ